MDDTKRVRDAEIELFDLWYGEDEEKQGFTPIEKIFYMACHRFYFGGGGPWNYGEFDIFYITPQAIIDKNNGMFGSRCGDKYYKVDFLITYSQLNLTPVQIVVELDGHNFHEKTKEQAEKDKKRDRVLQSFDYLVARFTGSEIYRDPCEAVLAIHRLAFSAWKNRRVVNG